MQGMNTYDCEARPIANVQPAGPSLQDIWDGDGTNDNAVLTVFRNFDNATVTRGFVGAIPKTLWVMDYPMLERTYYELVVNFNVFGSAASQAETRLYFDLIRSGGENNFLHFMPPGVRTAMRDSWYQGKQGRKRSSVTTMSIVNEDMPVQIRYRSTDPKAEFVALVSERLKSLAGPPDVLNRCARPPCYRAGATAAERQVDASLQTLTSKPASHAGMQFVDFMPDVSFVRCQQRRSRRGPGVYPGAQQGTHQCRLFAGRGKTPRAGQGYAHRLPRTAGQLPQFHVQRTAGQRRVICRRPACRAYAASNSSNWSVTTACPEPIRRSGRTFNGLSITCAGPARLKRGYTT